MTQKRNINIPATWVPVARDDDPELVEKVVRRFAGGDSIHDVVVMSGLSLTAVEHILRSQNMTAIDIYIDTELEHAHGVHVQGR